MTFAKALSYFIVMFTVAMTAFTVHKAYSQQRQMFPAFCMPMEVLDKTAKDRFGEHPVASGTVVPDSNYILFYQNPKTKSFTVVSFSKASGTGCVIASGDHWAPLKDGRSDL